mmetsp:Transcript_11781/g.24017  ORF Transcript_11781/g.24017 Transcript_11781/m.24017 type:complete len:222 (+) Transcript_11781:729-1394(+)
MMHPQEERIRCISNSLQSEDEEGYGDKCEKNPCHTSDRPKKPPSKCRKKIARPPNVPKDTSQVGCSLRSNIIKVEEMPGHMDYGKNPSSNSSQHVKIVCSIEWNELVQDCPLQNSYQISAHREQYNRVGKHLYRSRSTGYRDAISKYSAQSSHLFVHIVCVKSLSKDQPRCNKEERDPKELLPMLVVERAGTDKPVGVFPAAFCIWVHQVPAESVIQCFPA